jgi:hypothetical protein
MSNNSATVVIYTSNEIENKQKIESYFKRSGIPKPVNWMDYGMYWDKSDSIELLKYMGEPLPGFEYKWDVRR